MVSVDSLPDISTRVLALESLSAVVVMGEESSSIDCVASGPSEGLATSSKSKSISGYCRNREKSSQSVGLRESLIP